MMILGIIYVCLLIIFVAYFFHHQDKCDKQFQNEDCKKHYCCSCFHPQQYFWSRWLSESPQTTTSAVSVKTITCDPLPLSDDKNHNNSAHHQLFHQVVSIPDSEYVDASQQHQQQNSADRPLQKQKLSDWIVAEDFNNNNFVSSGAAESGSTKQL
jgi:hypothetical protein